MGPRVVTQTWLMKQALPSWMYGRAMPPATSLVPMTEAQLADYLLRAIPAYARDKVASGQWTESEALARSRKNYAELLPEGVATPDHHLYVMHDEQAVVVGELWIGGHEQAGRRVAFVYDVAVHPEHRRKGHAERAFQALEGVVRSLGLAGIGLHVFGHNAAARALYLKLGYLETNVNMFKALGEEAGGSG